MTRRTVLSAAFLAVTLSGALAVAADTPPPEFTAAGEARRREIPLGGDFAPDPKVPVFVAVGHGGRILLSRDDGATWKQVFFGHPGSDHGGWATNAIGYTGGVFAVPVGWGGPTSYLASDDGTQWRHLTAGTAKLDRSGDPRLMPMTMSVAGGKQSFVFSGYMTMAATRDFGKTWNTFSLYSFKNDSRKLVTHHIKTRYLGDSTGRFLAVGEDRAMQNPGFGHLFASDDLSKTWKWLTPKGLNGLKNYSALESNGKVTVLLDKDAANAYRSTDGGETWEGPFPTGGRRATLNVVGSEFWLTGSPGRASADGKTWRDLPGAVPDGKIVASNTGTLINIDRARFTVLRSTDSGKTWAEVYKFEPETKYVHGAQGLRDVAFGLVRAKPTPGAKAAP